MANQNTAPRNTPDAVADELGWRHPQTGELLVAVRGLKVVAPAAKKLNLTTSKLTGVQPLEVTGTVVNAADLVGITIHWGDGSPDTKLELFDSADFSHTYHNVGECTLKVTATFNDFTTDTVTKLVKIKAPAVAKAAPKPKADEALTEAK